MTAKELIEKLSKLNPNTEVYTEQWSENNANQVMIATKNEKTIAYVGDDLEVLQTSLEEENYETKII